MVPYGRQECGALLDHLTFLPRLVRDHWFEKIAYYPFRAGDYPTSYLSQAGLALACDAFGGVPYVMYGIEGRPALVDWAAYQHIREGDRVWIRVEDLPAFNERILPGVRHRFVLVTGESDYTVPSDFPDAARTLARSGRVVRWFSTNYDASAHADLITGFPQGLNYAKKTDLHLYGRLGAMGMTRVDMKRPGVQEAEWKAALVGAPPLAERIPKAVADFHLNNSSRNRRYGESRQDIYRRLRDNPHVVWLSRRGSLARVLREYARHAFVISPHGRALDCYRTWEALLAGCIPIVKTSPIDYLYRDLPVAVVADWNEITAGNLARWLERFGAGFDRGPLQRVLSMEHWVSQLK